LEHIDPRRDRDVPIAETSLGRRSSAGKPIFAVLEITLLWQACRQARSRSVAGSGAFVVTIHLQQVPPDGVEAVVLPHPIVGV
jgi:hypothetical protein